MRHATLRQLKVFEAVARHLSYSRAAEELHLTQPAVSTQVGKLEEHAGHALFEQFGKKIFLAAAGSELLPIARGILLEFEKAEAAMSRFRGISGGRLNVGVISAGDYFFPRLLVEFIGRHPGVTLDFTVHNREELLARIAGNLTDLAIMVRPPTELDTLNQPFAPHLRVLDAQGFPLQLHWYVVHRRTKRLAPVAQAFRNFLVAKGAELIGRLVPWQFEVAVIPAKAGIQGAQKGCRP